MINADSIGNETTPHKLILVPSGIVPTSENDQHHTLAETVNSYDGISVTPYGDISPGSYDLYWQNGKLDSINLQQGGVFTFVIDASSSEGQEPRFLNFLVTKENSVHMLWLIPQFFVITVGEIMFSITALEFSYSQVILKMSCLYV